MWDSICWFARARLGYGAEIVESPNDGLDIIGNVPGVCFCVIFVQSILETFNGPQTPFDRESGFVPRLKVSSQRRMTLWVKGDI